MKTVTIEVPMEVVLPTEYDIVLKLDGDKSSLTVHEHYSQDIPANMVDHTIQLGKSLYPEVEFTKVTDYDLELYLNGTEEVIVNALLGEFELLRKAYILHPPRERV